MLAAHDQENLAFSRQTTAVAKQQGHQPTRQLQPKTPGARFPKTPIRVPLNDENATNFIGGKSLLGQRTKGLEQGKTVSMLGNKPTLVTPLEQRTRAPLGAKTTNAKARTTQTIGVKDIVREIEKTAVKPTTNKRTQKPAPKLEPAKLELHTDRKVCGDDEEEIEYAPPRAKNLPYESDVFPAGVLTFEGIRPENQLRGYHDFYYNPVDEDGVPLREREMEAQAEKAWTEAEQRMIKTFEDLDWSVSDVPGSGDFFKKKQQVDERADRGNVTGSLESGRLATRPPSTIAARKAASTLSVAPVKPASRPVPGPTSTKPGPMRNLLPGRKVTRPAPIRDSSAERVTAVAASRSTLGYTKGRSASSMVHARPVSQVVREGLKRSASTASAGSDTTITPARFAQGRSGKGGAVDEDLQRIEFLSIFDIDEDDGNLGVSDDGLFQDDVVDGDFQLKLEFD